MARVPTISERSVNPAGLAQSFQSSQGANVDAFGGSGSGDIQGGQQLQQAGGMFGQVALQIQAEDNDLEARQLETEWRTRVSSLLYGGQNTTGYFSTKSNDAIAGFAPTRQQIEGDIELLDLPGPRALDNVKPPAEFEAVRDGLAARTG